MCAGKNCEINQQLNPLNQQTQGSATSPKLWAQPTPSAKAWVECSSMKTVCLACGEHLSLLKCKSALSTPKTPVGTSPSATLSKPGSSAMPWAIGCDVTLQGAGHVAWRGGKSGLGDKPIFPQPLCLSPNKPLSKEPEAHASGACLLHPFLHVAMAVVANICFQQDWLAGMICEESQWLREPIKSSVSF